MDQTVKNPKWYRLWINGTCKGTFTISDQMLCNIIRYREKRNSDIVLVDEKGRVI